MFEHILDCPQCQKRFHYEYEGGEYPRLICCPECGVESAREEYTALVLCRACRVKIRIPLLSLHQNGNICPKCGEKISVDLQEAVKDGSDRKERKRMLQDGDFFDKYKIIRFLGKGGMAEVYLAEHLLLKQSCALKLMRHAIAHDNDPVYVKRFIREAKLTHRLMHPDIVRVFDAGSDFKTGYLFLAMEYVEGDTLHDIIHEKPLSECELLEILTVIGGALKALDTAKVVHRDIKPSNIMRVRTGGYKLMDLGIAKVESNYPAGDMTLTMEQSTIGTPGYASPEQCQAAHQADSRSDIYSLGATLYHAASGRVPFSGDTPMEVILKMIQQEAEPLRNYRKDLSEGFFALVEKMMRKKPEERFQNADELLAAVELVKQGKCCSATSRLGKNVFQSWAAYFFKFGNDGRQKKKIQKLFSVGAVLGAVFVLVLWAATYFSYFSRSKDGVRTGYGAFIKSLWGHRANPEGVLPGDFRADLYTRLQQMHPLIPAPDKELRSSFLQDRGNTVKGYSVSAVSWKNFQQYHFDTVHEDFVHLSSGMLRDGILDLSGSLFSGAESVPELTERSYGYCINFMLEDNEKNALFEFDGFELFVVNGSLQLVLNSAYHADIGITIPAGRWMNLMVLLNDDENKITFLSEDRFLGAWFFPGEAVSYAPFRFKSSLLGLRMNGKVDFLARSREPLTVRPCTPAVWKKLLSYAERLPDGIPGTLAPRLTEVKKTEKVHSSDIGEKTSPQTPPERVREVVPVSLPPWRNTGVRSIAVPAKTVDEHFAVLQKKYREYAADVKKLQDSLQDISATVPAPIAKNGRAIAEKAAELCRKWEQRLAYLQERNIKINAVKNKKYDTVPATPVPEDFSGNISDWLSREDCDPNIQVSRGDDKRFNGPVFKLVCSGVFLPQNELLQRLIGRYADPVVVDDIQGSGIDLMIRYGLQGQVVQKLFNEYCRSADVSAATMEKLAILFMDGAFPDGELLFHAVRSKNEELLLFLLACGSDPNTFNRQGETVLFNAYRMPDGECFRELLWAGGADSRKKSIDGKIASDFSNMADFTRIWEKRDLREIQKALVSGRMNLGAVLYNGKNLLTSACSRDDEDLVRMLLALGADPVRSDQDNILPMEAVCFYLQPSFPVAAAEKKFRIMLRLLAAGAGLNAIPQGMDRNSGHSVLSYIIDNFPNKNKIIPHLKGYLNSLHDSQWSRVLDRILKNPQESHLSAKNRQLLLEACSGKVLCQAIDMIISQPMTVRMLQRALDGGLDPDFVFCNPRKESQGWQNVQWPLLWHLIDTGQSAAVIETALSAGADPDWQDIGGRSLEQMFSLKTDIRRVLQKYQKSRR